MGLALCGTGLQTWPVRSLLTLHVLRACVVSGCGLLGHQLHADQAVAPDCEVLLAAADSASEGCWHHRVALTVDLLATNRGSAKHNG